MTDTKEDRIRQKAHKIWEEAGYPEGDHESHWQQAVDAVEAEDAAPVAKARAKKNGNADATAKTGDSADAPAKKPAAAAVKAAPAVKKPAATAKSKEAPLS